MAYSTIGGFPPQQLKSKRIEWKGMCNHLELETGECTDPQRKYDNHVFIVYMHINKINGMVYVGITHHVNPNKRWGYSGQKYTHCVKFFHAINKYGWENFDHIILCRTTKERAVVMEQTLIAHYKRLNMSYNLGEGGEGSQSFSEETKAKLKAIKSKNPAMKGRHHTLEARARISEAGRKRKMKEETRQKLYDKVWSKRKGKHVELSQKCHQRSIESNSRPVLQLDINNNVLREFPSTRVADEFIHNGKRHNHIADVCNGKRKTDGGYRWCYKEERRAI